LRLVADRLQARDALLQRRVAEIGDAGLDRVIKAFQAQVCLGGSLVQLGDVLAAALSAFLPAIEDGGQDFLEPLGWSKRPARCSATRLSSFSIGIERPLNPPRPAGP
jgi:hypothetical protein